MSLPEIKKRTAEDWSKESGAEIARLALMLADGDPHKDTRYPRLTQFPTRRRVADLIAGALRFGVHPDTIMADAWDFVEGDEGDDPAALDLVAEYRNLVSAGWVGSESDIDAAVGLLASFEPDSLWTRAVQAAYPEHPQTPGSAKWMEAEAAGNPHESVACPWTRKP